MRRAIAKADQELVTAAAGDHLSEAVPRLLSLERREHQETATAKPKAGQLLSRVVGRDPWEKFSSITDIEGEGAYTNVPFDGAKAIYARLR